MRPVPSAPPARLLRPGALLRLVACALASGLAACGGRVEPPANELGIRHVVLVSIDTLRADRLGCYGFEIGGRSPSPELDRFAASGVVVENHFSTAPTTLSSHTSLMTGTYPHRHGIPRNSFRVHPDNVMLAEVLRDAGFYTAAFVGAGPLSEAVNFQQGFAEFDFHPTLNTGGSPSSHQRRADEVTDATLAWLDARYGDEVDEPLFLFVHYFDVHHPYEAPAPYGGMYRETALPRGNANKQLNTIKSELEPEEMGDEDFLARVEATRPEGLVLGKALDAEYCAEITYVDHHLQRLFDSLRERGVLDRALVVVTADHGETMYEHTALFSHGETVFDTEIKTPLILHFPGERYAGTRLGRLASSVDVVPTILEALGVPIPGRVEGESFLPVLAKGPDALPPRAPVFAEATKPWRDERFSSDPVWVNRGKFQALRTTDHKLVLRDPDGQRRLYDLVQDPLEQHDRIAVSADLAAELEPALRAWMARADPLPSVFVDTEEQVEMLKNLGYLGEDEDDEDDGGGGDGGR